MFNKIQAPTLIAEGSHTQGTLIFSSEARIFGAIEGEVRFESTEQLQVGRTGWIHGNIEADGPVYIDGRVDGNVSSRCKITLSSHGRVLGKLIAPRVEIMPGAQIDGEVHAISLRANHPPLKQAA